MGPRQLNCHLLVVLRTISNEGDLMLVCFVCELGPLFELNNDLDRQMAPLRVLSGPGEQVGLLLDMDLVVGLEAFGGELLNMISDRLDDILCQILLAIVQVEEHDPPMGLPLLLEHALLQEISHLGVVFDVNVSVADVDVYSRVVYLNCWSSLFWCFLHFEFFLLFFFVIVFIIVKVFFIEIFFLIVI